MSSPNPQSQGQGERPVCLRQGAVWSHSCLGVVHLGSLPAASARVVAWLGVGAGITALTPQAWGTGVVGRGATVSWHRDLSFCHPMESEETPISHPSCGGRQLCSWKETRLLIPLQRQLTGDQGTSLTLSERACLSFHLGKGGAALHW